MTFESDGIFANIKHFFTNPKTGEESYDEHGTLLSGWYYQIFFDENNPITKLTGPFKTEQDAKEACKYEWENGNHQH